MKTKSFIYNSIVALLILLWGWAALSKWFSPGSFFQQLDGSYLTHSYSEALFYLVPTVQLMVIALLLFDRYRLIGMLASFALLLSFTAYVVYVLYYSPAVPCSCGGILPQFTWREHLYFNLIFLLVNLIGVFLEIRGSRTLQVNPPAGSVTRH